EREEQRDDPHEAERSQGTATDGWAAATFQGAPRKTQAPGSRLRHPLEASEQLVEDAVNEAGSRLFRERVAKQFVSQGGPPRCHRSTSRARSSAARAVCNRDFAVPSATPSRIAISFTGRPST